MKRTIILTSKVRIKVRITKFEKWKTTYKLEPHLCEIKKPSLLIFKSRWISSFFRYFSLDYKWLEPAVEGERFSKILLGHSFRKKCDRLVWFELMTPLTSDKSVPPIACSATKENARVVSHCKRMFNFPPSLPSLPTKNVTKLYEWVLQWKRLFYLELGVVEM